MDSKVYRCYAEKREGFNVEAARLCSELKTTLGIRDLLSVRILNRYDIQGIDDTLYARARTAVFSEPQCDDVYDETFPPPGVAHRMLAVESLPGQYDQRADSCSQCTQILSRGKRPEVRTAKVYLFYGEIGDEDFLKIQNFLVNPVESRTASFDKPLSLKQKTDAPEDICVINGFIELDPAGLEDVLHAFGLAMDMDDLVFLQRYFRDDEKRDPTETELRVLDTYWSDHCRHTTFSTKLEDGVVEDESILAAYNEYLSARQEIYGAKADSRPVTLMDLATSAMKLLRSRGLLEHLDQSDEINACTVKITVDADGREEPWLLLFKNETHNHPTEIEPFGGAATCLGGAIRDPLSGRAYVYQAMRVTGAGDPRVPLSETLPGKLPQRVLTNTAAAGYSSYGNQIGLSTGLVEEIYHPGYIAKRMEIGAVIGAAPLYNVVRECPRPGDVVILLGGRTGRDGCGGATGSSKSHTRESLETCGAEVQKGNPPEERKIQRLFRNPEITRLIRRCNDFGAGGVSVAVGELADGLRIDLSAIPKKYEGLGPTELAISESQERMAVVVAPEDVNRFISGAAEENLEATQVAVVSEAPRLVMMYDGRRAVDISRSFLNTNGAPKRAHYHIPDYEVPVLEFPHYCGGPASRLKMMAADLEFCSRRGMVERFDSTIGASSVLMPYGGRHRLSPVQVMAAKLPVEGETDTCSVMSFGFNPYLCEKNPFIGAISAVTESLAKLVAAGCSIENAYLTLQEYFERLGNCPERWGKPMAALLGAFSAQMGYQVAAVGGKDSMSGSFGELNVPPTLVSFAVAVHRASRIISPEFKAGGNRLYVFAAPYENDGTPCYNVIRDTWRRINCLAEEGKIISMWSLGGGGVAEGIIKMSLGNRIGVRFDPAIDVYSLFEQNYGGILAECTDEIPGAVLLGHTVPEGRIYLPEGSVVSVAELSGLWELGLENVFQTRTRDMGRVPKLTFTGRNTARPLIKAPRPRAVIPVFPGTNCEYDTARAVVQAGGEAEVLVIRNISAEALAESVSRFERAIREAQMLVIPGGFSGGDEPEGSGKFICSFFRNPGITLAVNELVKHRDGLVLGICNGFQALIKLGLLHRGEICEADAGFPTLTYNNIGRHQSRYVRTRISSVLSPWLSLCEAGDIHSVPISHGEGRFVANGEVLTSMISAGQIATQYVDENGMSTMDISINPNGSMYCVEGISSPDGRILGKMAHSERIGKNIAVNIDGNKDQRIFEAGVQYFR